MTQMNGIGPEPDRDCPLCPRLVAYRLENRRLYPDGFNGPAPSFGDEAAQILVLGLAPGRMGANLSGRPFTGDYAGVLLYQTLLKFGLASGTYQARADDGLVLKNTFLTNAVRCAPPANKPTTDEEITCRAFLQQRLIALSNLKVIITLGDVARRNLLKALGAPASLAKGGHGAEAKIGPYHLINSYHCSRLNTNTGRLTAPMFEAIFSRALEILSQPRD